MVFFNDEIKNSVAEWFYTNFPPALAVADADLLMNTAELKEKIDSVFPEVLTNEDLVSLLIKKLYATYSFGNMNTVWLIKNKHNA